MSDSLRDRIAAALYRQYPPYQLGYTFGCPSEQWADESERCKDVYRRDADAVIAELGLYREGRESRTVTNEQGATYRIEGGHRYVTDWKSDDE